MIINKPWYEGGTGITNFQRDKLPIVQAAIAECGDSSLTVSEIPMPPATAAQGYLSLHDLSGNGKQDISKFWEIYRRLDANPVSESAEKLVGS